MHSKRKQLGDRASWRLKAGTIFALLFLHVPIVVIILYAFTTDERTFRFPPPGLTTKWFETVITSRPDFWTALVLSLQVAAIATGAADPAAEERFNLWMDSFLALSESRQRGELTKLEVKEKAGTLTPDEQRQIGFVRNLLGITKVPELSAADLARVKAGKTEEIALNVVGERKSALPMFLAMAGVGAVAIIAAGKRGK